MSGRPAAVLQDSDRDPFPLAAAEPGEELEEEALCELGGLVLIRGAPGLRLQGRERVLVVLVACSGRVHRRTVEHPGGDDQRELDRIAATLNERVVGHTLDEVLVRLRDELAQLRARANDLLERALRLGLQALDVDEPDSPDLLLGTRLALLGQPEFHDLEQVRELFAAIETGACLVDLVDRLVDADGVHVALGEALELAALHRFALVAAPYGRQGEPPQGVLGVIGPCRMDYRRVIPLVDYCSTIVSDKLALADEPGDAAPL